MRRKVLRSGEVAGLPAGRSEAPACKQVDFADAAFHCAAASAPPRAARARVAHARTNGRTPASAGASTRQTRTRGTHARTGTGKRTHASASRLCGCITDQNLIVTSTCPRRNDDRACMHMARMNIATRQRQPFFCPPRWRGTSLGHDAPWNPTTAFPRPHERSTEPVRAWHRKAALNTLSPAPPSPRQPANARHAISSSRRTKGARLCLLVLPCSWAEHH